MTVRIEFPIYAQFEFVDPGNNSRELRTEALQVYLRNTGIELGHPIEAFLVDRFRGDDNGEFWEVKTGRF